MATIAIAVVTGTLKERNGQVRLLIHYTALDGSGIQENIESDLVDPDSLASLFTTAVSDAVKRQMALLGRSVGGLDTVRVLSALG